MRTNERTFNYHLYELWIINSFKWLCLNFLNIIKLIRMVCFLPKNDEIAIADPILLDITILSPSHTKPKEFHIFDAFLKSVKQFNPSSWFLLLLRHLSNINGNQFHFYSKCEILQNFKTFLKLISIILPVL